MRILVLLAILSRSSAWQSPCRRKEIAMCAVIIVRRTPLGETIIVEDTPDPKGECFATYDPAFDVVECWEVNCDGYCQLHARVINDDDTEYKCCCGGYLAGASTSEFVADARCVGGDGGAQRE